MTEVRGFTALLDNSDDFFEHGRQYRKNGIAKVAGVFHIDSGE